MVCFSFADRPIEPDLMVNEFKFNSAKEVEERYGNVTECCMIRSHNTPSHLSEVIFLSENRDTYLALIHFNGGFVNEFSRFRVGYVDYDSTSFEKAKYTRDIKQFVTNNGIKLGMTVAQVRNILPFDFKESRKGEVYTLTFCFDYNNEYLEVDNEYEAHYNFVNGKLVNFDFGYVMP